MCNIFNSFLNITPANAAWGRSYKVQKIFSKTVNSIQDGLFRGCSRMVEGEGGSKRPPFLKSVTHILQ